MQLEIENKVYLTAFSLGDDLLEEIKQRAFDEETIMFSSINLDELTLPSDLGPDIGETLYIDFDDIDDYKGYIKQVSLPHAEGFSIQSNLYYVQEDTYQISNTQTFYKKAEVTVSSKYLRYPVILSFIFTLHSK